MMRDDDRLPDLQSPIMVCAFSGWNDAGEASTAAVEHLALSWDATPYAALDDEDYFDYQVNRPQVALIDGVSRRMTWPSVDLSIARLPLSARDIVLVSGPEPSFRWRVFCDALLDIARDLGVEQIVLLGGVGVDTHYAREVPLSGAAWDAVSASIYGLDDTRYEGPSGITGALHDAAVRRGFPTLSFWAGTPFYVSAPVWTPATVALLRKVEEVIGEPVDLRTLQQQAEASIERVRELVDSDPMLREQIEAIGEVPTIDDSTADQLAADFERYLRNQGDDD